MRNLKRALSLALAAIMLVGMMVVSASAASYNDLTDKDQIVNKDAVSMRDAGRHRRKARRLLCPHRGRGPRPDGEDDLRHHESGRG